MSDGVAINGKGPAATSFKVILLTHADKGQSLGSKLGNFALLWDVFQEASLSACGSLALGVVVGGVS
eukprot:Ihof_evm5s450 gene=Ihof_evmTU5s450